MSFPDKLHAGIPTLSYEVFPPKNKIEWGALYETLGSICKQAPDFISVTYRGGVSTRERTVDLVGRIQRELEIETVAHLTCISHSEQELREILTSLQASGVNHIIALRGDRPKKGRPKGFDHASDLIRLARKDFDFHIACAFYPEKHPDAATLAEDVHYLKYKQECGADAAISQFFFDNEDFYRFRALAHQHGVTLPLIAGIMPVTSSGQLRRFRELSGTEIPTKLTDYLGEASGEEVVERGIEYGIAQCEDLLRNGVAGIHLYTLNKSASSIRISEALRARGFFEPLPGSVNVPDAVSTGAIA